MTKQPLQAPAWELPVRLIHWSVAALVLVNLFNETGKLHRSLGYGAAGLVVLRLLLGLLRPAGSPASLRPPALTVVLAHIRELLRGEVTPHVGHNPLGYWMALCMWGLILALGVTGWMTRLDEYWGEEWLMQLHEQLAFVLQACIPLHLAGVALMSRLQRVSLVRAMIRPR
jgi:cytochrome b